MRPEASASLADLTQRTADTLAAGHVGVVVGAVRGDGDTGGRGGRIAAAIRLSRDVTHPVNRWTWSHLGWLGVRLHPRFGGAHQIWHNGGTGGFRSWLGFVPGERAGVVVLTNTARSPDAQAFDLLRVLAFGGHLRAGRP